MATGSARLALARTAFLSEGVMAPEVVREPILASWTRSRLWRVPVDHLDVPFESDLDSDLDLFIVDEDAPAGDDELARTTLAVNELKAAGLPYVVVTTDPTTGGVTASYAMLGDVHLAEPNATIGFSGRRVIEQTIRETLPPGFQRSEFLVERGMIDKVVHRKDLPEVLCSILRTLMMGRERSRAA